VNQAGAREQLSAGGLALLVHLLFFGALVFGVSWKKPPEIPVYADLWAALPPAPVHVPEPAPEAASIPDVEPARPAPPPVAEPPKPAPAPAKVDPDIAIKEKQAREAEMKRKEQIRLADEKKARENAEKQQRIEDERKRNEAERRRKLEDEMQREERERLLDEEKQMQLRREAERKAAEAKRLAQEKARKDMEAQLAADMASDLAAETRAISQQQAAMARMKVVQDYKLRIQAKIKGVMINPPGLTGHPEAVFTVELLPNGEVVRATRTRSSGQAAYDKAVETAILKASPFPLPADKAAAAAFRDGLEIRFRPD
jgi:colicin import membrane protein